MSRKVDITEKLSFEENPVLIIKGVELEINSDAPTVLKVMNLMSNEDPGVDEVLKAFDLIFTKQAKTDIEKLKIGFNDLLVIVQEAIQMIIDTGESQGE